MKKIFRIRKREDFVLASADGLCCHADFFVVLARSNSYDHYRVGFTASKKVGNAVVRNTCKRRMRAMARTFMPSLGIDGVDYIFIAKKTLITAKWDELINEATKTVALINKKLKRCNDFSSQS